MNLENPTPVLSAQSRVTVHIAPDCDIIAILPSKALLAAKEALRPEAVSMIPRQLGPIILIPYLSQREMHSRSRRAPSTPASLKPADITIILSTPAMPHSLTASGTILAGTTIIARSALFSPGTAVILG